MKNRFKPILALLAIAALFVAPVEAQNQLDFVTALYRDSRPIAVNQTAVSTDVALLIRYVGPQVSGTVDVAANGDITFKHGAVGAEVVDTSVECDASIAATGSRVGIWDVSVAACNTIGEGAAIINSQVNSSGNPNWIIVPLDALASDDLDWSGNGGLVTVTGQAANTLDGYSAKWDTAVTFTSTQALLPTEFRSMKAYVSGVTKPITLRKDNPFKDWRTIVGAVNVKSTYASGTSTYALSSVLPNYVSSTAFTETVSTLYSVTGAATTVNLAPITFADPVRVIASEGRKVIGRLTNSAAMSAITHGSYGLFIPTVVGAR